jgi:predicted RNA-binding protein with PUA-like domain
LSAKQPAGAAVDTDRGRWLFKEEPTHYPFDRLVKDGETTWDGVENNLALKHLRNVRKGDPILFYHTGEERRVVGIMSAVSDPYPDPARDDGRFVVVDVRPVRKLPRPVALAEMKADERFSGFDLIRIGRLSVMPVPERFWAAIMEDGGIP